MKSDIILAGVGGQGILSIAATIGMAALENDLHLKQSEVHGMSQRGGSVQSHLRISDKPISSDLIPAGQADNIISVEPMESLRYLNYLKNDGWVVTNSKPFLNIPDYPELDKVLMEIKSLKNHVLLDADKIAREIKSARSSNIVILGAASPFIDIPYESLESGIRKIFERKGEKIVNLNIDALKAGREFAEEHTHIGSN
jgi:indolepyruvate ferredoxin oxidoreductase beta subunit